MCAYFCYNVLLCKCLLSVIIYSLSSRYKPACYFPVQMNAKLIVKDVYGPAFASVVYARSKVNVFVPALEKRRALERKVCSTDGRAIPAG